MATCKLTGEPYELSGKRIVFTDYSYIRTAGFGWYNNHGNNVSVIGNQGPWDAFIRLTERPFGISITAQQAKRSDKPYTIESVKPWERDGVTLGSPQYGNILYDDEDGYFKEWGTCTYGDSTYICYMQSRDFENWERPDLGLLEFNGSKHNNLVDTGGDFGCVFKDPSSKEERWKWIKEATITRDEYDEYRRRRPDAWDPKSDRVDVPCETHIGNSNVIIAAKGGVSSDGFGWKPIREPLVVEHTDTIITAYYDIKHKKYVGYFRDWMVGERSSASLQNGETSLSWMSGRRAVGRAETYDFRNFPLSEIILEPGPDITGPSDVIYTNGHSFIPGAPEQHVFFPTIWHQDNDSTSVAIVVSNDGKVLHWLPGNPVLTTSDFMEWDGGCIFAHNNILELHDGKWILPYTGSNLPHKYPRKDSCHKQQIGFAIWEKGRMIALEAKEYGQFTTYAFIPKGRKILINALTLRGGNIIVEITNMKHEVVPGHSFEDCDPVIGDKYKDVLTWNGYSDIDVPDNTPICLRFRMNYAKLFWLDFE